MCYSAMVEADYRSYIRMYGAGISIHEFVQMFSRRGGGRRIVIPKAVEDAFLRAADPEVAEIQSFIRAFRKGEETKLQQDLFAQRKRLADAERDLLTKQTKKASESRRIALDKIEKLESKLKHLNRTESRDSDARMYPMQYVPVMVMENGKRVVRPMRYHCRPAGKPAFLDQKLLGNYNARRDNLEGYWGELFGFSHGIAIVNAFYENVATHRAEGRELQPGEEPTNTVLEFRPQVKQDMLVACLWSHWVGEEGEDLTSFAFITDEPPAEVAAAGHDRCIIPIKPENVDRWLNPKGQTKDDMYAILDDRERPYYEHRLAA